MAGFHAKIVDQEMRGALEFQLCPQDLVLRANDIQLAGIGKVEGRSIIAPRRTASRG